VCVPLSLSADLDVPTAQIALTAKLLSLRSRGRLVVRFDDVDSGGSQPDCIDRSLYDLYWLGIFPDAVERQSRRRAFHDAAVESLKQSGALYACYETPKELESRRFISLWRKRPHIYGRMALAYSKQERATFEAEGRRPHWRFLLPNHRRNPFDPVRTDIAWSDIVRGDETLDLGALSDPVLVDEDGNCSNILSSVIDDIESGVTHVVRGDEYRGSTGVQIALFQAFGATVPTFGHVSPPATDGQSLGMESISIRSLRESGLEAMTVASLSVLSGTSKNVVPAVDIMNLAERFEPATAAQLASKFASEDIIAVNRILLKSIAFEAVRDRLVAFGVMGEKAEPFWLAVRDSLDRVQDVRTWWKIVTVRPETTVIFNAADIVYLREACNVLPKEPWDRYTFAAWTAAVREKTNSQNEALIRLLRLALTGRENGPQLADLLPLLGRAATLARLRMNDHVVAPHPTRLERPDHLPIGWESIPERARATATEVVS